MGIIDRLSRLLRSNINDAITKSEHPEKMLNQIIEDMRDQLVRAKQEVAVAIADERKLRAQFEDERKQAADWEQRAVLAVRESRDDLARQALMRQEEHNGRASTLEETWRRQSAETDKLKASLRELNDRIEEAKRKKNLLVAKQKRAEAQKRIHETMAGLSDRSAFEAFDRMADRIEENERRTLASAEVTAELSAGDPMEQEFKQLEKGDNADARLLDLKRQMGLLPPAAEPKSDGASPKGNAKQISGPQSGPRDQVRDAELLEEFEELERGEAQSGG